MIDWADLERRNAEIGAFVAFDRTASGGNGSLAGVTVGVKSNIAVCGLPWTGGMAHMRDVIAERDANVVAMLRGAGAQILGTLNMHEAALGATTDNPFYGRTQNPLRIGYAPGGSSGGSAAALAAGLCDLALGTDTLGSIRIPAAYCGVYGLKPTYGAVDDDGLLFLDDRLDVIGPMARNLDMLERGWQVIGQPGPDAAFSSVITLAGLAGVECQTAVLAGYHAVLAATGLPITEMHLPDNPKAIRRAALAGVCASLTEQLDTDIASISDELRSVLAAVARIPEAPELLDATGMVMSRVLGTDGVLITPTTPHVAFAHGTRAPESQADFTGLANVAGLPALAMPSGFDNQGLPVSVQLVGPPGSEGRLIALARQIASARAT